MIIVEPGVTNPGAKLFPGSMGIYSDSLVDGLSRLAGGIKKHDCLAFIQPCHAGPRARTLNGARPVSAWDVPIIRGVAPRPL